MLHGDSHILQIFFRDIIEYFDRLFAYWLTFEHVVIFRDLGNKILCCKLHFVGWTIRIIIPVPIFLIEVLKHVLKRVFSKTIYIYRFRIITVDNYFRWNWSV